MMISSLPPYPQRPASEQDELQISNVVLQKASQVLIIFRNVKEKAKASWLVSSDRDLFL